MRIIIRKRAHTLRVISGRTTLFFARVSTGRSKGQKHCEGDNKTPEGTYRVCSKNAASKFCRALGLSYPNRRDMAYARRHGLLTAAAQNAMLHAEYVPWDSPAGGYIMIHGQKKGLTLKTDWTAGCIALADEDIIKLFEMIPRGTPVTIKR